MSLYVKSIFKEHENRFWFARFEDAVKNPKDFVSSASSNFCLDASKYPWEKIDEVGVHGSSSLAGSGDVKWSAVDKPAGFRPVGHWQSWSSYRRVIFKSIAGNLLVEMGYGGEEGW